MVFLGGEGVDNERREVLSGAAGEMVFKSSPVRPSRFHNFSFPTMNWGCQRILRCVNVSEITASADLFTQIETQGEKNASYSPVSPLPMSPHAGESKEKEAEQENASSAAADDAATEVSRPWNLRKRKASRYTTLEIGRNRFSCSSPSNLPLSKDNPVKAVMERSVVGENGRRREFSVSLLREEIEEDFYVFKGMKPNRRPRKRPVVVQKKLNGLFPGCWLSEITADCYKVDE